jgi:hypothetical protein
MKALRRSIVWRRDCRPLDDEEFGDLLTHVGRHPTQPFGCDPIDLGGFIHSDPFVVIATMAARFNPRPSRSNFLINAGGCPDQKQARGFCHDA